MRRRERRNTVQEEDNSRAAPEAGAKKGPDIWTKALTMNERLDYRTKKDISVGSSAVLFALGCGLGFTNAFNFVVLGACIGFLLMYSPKKSALILAGLALVAARQTCSCLLEACVCSYPSWVDSAVLYSTLILAVASFFWQRHLIEAEEKARIAGRGR